MPADRIVLPALSALWRQRGELRLSWQVLQHGACGECSLGVAGLTDATLPGAHLCARRLERLSRFTASPLPVAALRDLRDLRDLRGLGRLGTPMLRRGHAPGFTPVSWEDAAALASARLQDARTASRWTLRIDPAGLDLESLWMLGRVARLLGLGERGELRLEVPEAERALRARARELLGHASGTGGPLDLQPGDRALLIHDGDQPLMERTLEALRERGALLRTAGPTDPWPRDVRHTLLFGRPGTTAALAAGLPLGPPEPGPGRDGTPEEPDAAWLVGPQRGAVPSATLRIHQASFVDEAMLAPAAEAVLLLPAVPPSEAPGGGSLLSDDQVVRFSPPILGAPPTRARPHWDIAVRIAAHADPDAAARIAVHDSAELRLAVARDRPVLAGLTSFRSSGDAFRLPSPLP